MTAYHGIFDRTYNSLGYIWSPNQHPENWNAYSVITDKLVEGLRSDSIAEQWLRKQAHEYANEKQIAVCVFLGASPLFLYSPFTSSSIIMWASVYVLTIAFAFKWNRPRATVAIEDVLHEMRVNPLRQHSRPATRRVFLGRRRSMR